MLKEYLPTIYAVGLNLPLAVFYGWSAGLGREMELILNALIWLGLVVLLIAELRKTSENGRIRLAMTLVLLGTLLMWGSLFLVVPNLGKPESPAAVFAGDISLFGGLASIFAGLLAAYLSQRRAIKERQQKPVTK